MIKIEKNYLVSTEKISKALNQANMTMDTHLDWEINKDRVSQTNFRAWQEVFDEPCERNGIDNRMCWE